MFSTPQEAILNQRIGARQITPEQQATIERLAHPDVREVMRQTKEHGDSRLAYIAELAAHALASQSALLNAVAEQLRFAPEPGPRSVDLGAILASAPLGGPCQPSGEEAPKAS